jgi:5-hydroxyisourate hydrolase-like protein (transthyretin family)
MSSSAADRNWPCPGTLSVIITDAVRGWAAEGVLCLVERQVAGNWQTVIRGTSDSSGTLSVDELIGPGIYRIGIDADPYFAATGIVALLPKVTVTFRISEVCRHSELRAYIAANAQFSTLIRSD